MDLLPAPRQKHLFCVCMLRGSEKSASLFSGGAEQTKSVFFSLRLTQAAKGLL
jgi:hypothetical protein